LESKKVKTPFIPLTVKELIGGSEAIAGQQ
jgi:hypothetical protein